MYRGYRSRWPRPTEARSHSSIVIEATSHHLTKWRKVAFPTHKFSVYIYRNATRSNFDCGVSPFARTKASVPSHRLRRLFNAPIATHRTYTSDQWQAYRKASRIKCVTLCTHKSSEMTQNFSMLDCYSWRFFLIWTSCWSSLGWHNVPEIACS